VLLGHITQGPEQRSEARLPRPQSVNDGHIGLVVDNKDDMSIPEEGTVLYSRRGRTKEFAPLDCGAGVLASRITVGG
jgi:hypothetical protein